MAIVVALYFAREILLPLALSFLVSFLLAPLVKRIERLRIRRVPSVLIAVSIAFGLTCLLGYALVLQVYTLASNLPQYKSNIAAKLESFQARNAGVVGIVRDVLAGVGRPAGPKSSASTGTILPEAKSSGSLFSGDKVPTAHAAAGPEKTPVPVEIVSEFSAGQIVQGFIGPLVGPVESAATVLIFVIFILIDRENLRNRLLHLIGSRQLNTTTQALDDAAQRVSRYLLMQSIVNSVFGMAVAAGLLFIGVPNAFLWGVLAAALRFLPYVGPFIAAGIPFIVATAIFPGWTPPALVLGLFLLSELFINNAVEPWLYSASTGISSIGLLVSAIFWTWLWGPIGLILATPLTVCITVLGRHVPHLSFFNKLLGDEDLLPPASRFYQRLLAMDRTEAVEVAEAFLKNSTLESLFDEVLLPALGLAEQDRHHDDLDETKQQFIWTTVRELAADFSKKTVPNEPTSVAISNEPQAVASTTPPSLTRVLCLPASDEADEVAAFVLSQLLAARGIVIEVMSAQAFSGEMITHVSEEEHSIVCISALPPRAAKHVRVLCKRLRAKFPLLKIVVGLWRPELSTRGVQSRLAALGIDSLVTTLTGAANYLSHAILASNVLLAACSAPANPDVSAVRLSPGPSLDGPVVAPELQTAEPSL